MRENVFHILLDKPTILQKSTRHVIYDHKLPESEIDKKGKKHYENYLTTFSTIVIRGLLDDFCFSHSDCTINHSVCSKRTRRCMCKGGSQRSENGKSCILDSDMLKYCSVALTTSNISCK